MTLLDENRPTRCATLIAASTVSVELTPLGPLPIVSLEEDVKSQAPPELELVGCHRRMHRVSVAAVSHDLDPLHERNAGVTPLSTIRTSSETTPATR